MAPSAHKNEGKAVPDLVRDRLSATLSLNAPVSSLEGVGPKRAHALGLRGIQSLRDLLDCYPRRYVDMSCVRSVAEARIGEHCTVVGMVHSVSSRKTRQRNLSLVEIGVLDASGILMVTCFNQPWLARKLASGMRVSVSGKIEFNYGFKRMTSPIIVVLEPEDEAGGVVLPLHPASAEVPRTMMARLVSESLSKVRGCIDPLPASLRTRYRLCSRYQAWHAIHEPETPADIAMARRRLIYEELLLLELGLMARSRNRRPGASPYVQVTKGPRLDALRRALPFALTDEQEAAVADIFARMADSSCMDHLLLGDVGTGKTAVALFALVAATEGGHQALMMGPTEVLVRQYARSVGPLLDEAGVTWAILTGTTPAAERADVLGRFSEGSLDVLLGTHALLSDDVRPNDCSVVVIDEQQRFGVEQRGALVAKAPDSDVLSMTATPIPRSLALALYGDLTLSYLTCRPQALSPRITKVCHFEEEGRAYDAIREALSRGEQAYIVCPLIGVATEALRPSDYEVEEDPGADSVVEYAFVEGLLEQGDFDPAGKVVSAATTHARILSESVFPEARVALLHGRMATDEKNRVMRDFVAGDIDILVSTTVVEVGVDVPNATVMVVEDADRFGLAQLHQLRGRVGRGVKPASVFLISRSRAPEALARLQVMEDVDDGFELSERDLALRREGDVFGGRQHGASRLKLVNVVRDAAVVKAAAEDARAILDDDILTTEELVLLKQELALREEHS